MQFLNRLERKYGKYAVSSIMSIIVFGMALVFLLDIFASAKGYAYSFSYLLYFDRELILQGQVWRILTFLFLPPDSSLFFMIFALYFYWLIGNSLEHQWGCFRFNVYYLCGIIGTILGGLLTGYADNTYLNLSLYLAFAAIFPNFEVLLFFMIPIKIKYIAILDVIFLAILFLISSLANKVSILIALLNFLLFFGKDIWTGGKGFFRRKKYKRQNQNNWKNNHWWSNDDNHPWKK